VHSSLSPASARWGRGALGTAAGGRFRSRVIAAAGAAVDDETRRTISHASTRRGITRDGERPGWLGTQRGGAPARLRRPLMRRRAILWPGAPRRLGPDLSSRTRNYLIYDEINSSQIDEKTSQNNIYDGFVTILINVIE